MEFTSSDKAPKALGAYSQAVKTGNLVFTSGQLGIDPVTGKLGETAAQQAEQALKNLEQILITSGSALNKVLKATVFVDDLANFKEINGIYATFMGDHKPARSFVQVAKLPLEAKIMIDMIAEI